MIGQIQDIVSAAVVIGATEASANTPDATQAASQAGSQQQDQQDRPEQLDPHRCILLPVSDDLPVGVLAGHQGDGVKGGGVEGDHGQRQQDQNEAGQGQGLQHGDDGVIQAGFRIDGKKIHFSAGLDAESVVPEDDKGGPGASDSAGVSADDDLADGPAAADAADEERCRDAPYHPVSPVEDGPVLGEAGLTERVRVGGEFNEVLCHLSDIGEAGLQDIAGHAAGNQDEGQERKEEPDAGGGHPGDAVDAEPGTDGVENADDQQDRDAQRSGIRDPEDCGHSVGKKRRGDGEGGGGARDQCEDCQKIHKLSCPSVRQVSQQRPAGLGILLAVPLADMDHEAEGYSESHVESPRDRTPVEQRKDLEAS